MEGSSDPAPATPRAPVAGSGAGARAPRRRRAPRSIDEARGSALAPTLRDSRSARADLRDGQDGRHRSPPRPSSVPDPLRCVLRRPSTERAPVVQGLGELSLERGHAKAKIVWPAGRARRAVRSEAVQGSYEVPPGGRASHPVLWRSPPHRCAASAIRRVLGTRARHFGQRGAHGRDQELRDCVSANGLGVSTSGSKSLSRRDFKRGR